MYVFIFIISLCCCFSLCSALHWFNWVLFLACSFLWTLESESISVLLTATLRVQCACVLIRATTFLPNNIKTLRCIGAEHLTTTGLFFQDIPVDSRTNKEKKELETTLLTICALVRQINDIKVLNVMYWLVKSIKGQRKNGKSSRLLLFAVTKYLTEESEERKGLLQERRGLTVQPQLAWDSLCKPGRP